MSYEKRTLLADEMLQWVGEELTKEQVESAVWAVAMIKRNDPEMLDAACKEIYNDVEAAMVSEEGN